MATVQSAPPIFILGISQRSGTNFLFDLLRLHPDCAAPSTNWEDFLLYHADSLAEYVDAVCRGWRRRGIDGSVEDLLYARLGEALISVLAARAPGKRIVTKTPSVRNLEFFFKLFPGACLLILVRDGRAVTESRVKTFGESYETAMRRWAEGADRILRFRASADPARCNYRIVRYEDLWNDLDAELRRLCAFLRLDPARYDFHAAANLPVRGSSHFHGDGEERVHWKPVAKTADFNPIGRWHHWPAALRQRFDWLAGEKQAAFGYERAAGESPCAWKLRNKVADGKWKLSQLCRSLGRAGKKMVKAVLGPARASEVRRRLISFARPLSG
ncbi:MAG TPA: sulfotransferase [Candidatus Acidoferrales bacterium]|nr:sulfotransferase [Candidatus Acidoferrales bacterium]